MSELLYELVRRYSPSQYERPAVAYLVDWMGRHGYEARIDEMGNTVGMRGAADAPRTLMLLGHIDTVSGEIPVRVEDGILYGRGSVDAKGSLCTFAEAASQATIPPGWKVIVAGAVEEETPLSRGAEFLRERITPDLVVIGEPSGSDRITLGYKGRLLVEYSLSRNRVHSARPEPSVGALGAAFWQKIYEWSEALNTGVDRYFDYVMPDLASISTASDGFNEILRMTVGFRLPVEYPPEKVMAVVRSFAEPGASIHNFGGERAYQSDKNTPLVRGMLAAIRAQGGKPGFVYKTGTSDMNIVGVRWKCPMVAYGPGDSNLDHTPNEHIPLSEYQVAVNTMRWLIEHIDQFMPVADDAEAGAGE